MDENLLTEEISNASSRIEARQAEIEIELNILDNKIEKFTSWAWHFVWVGLVISLFSIIYFVFKNTEAGFGLNLLGDFMAGTVASIWSLAGLFFIYVAFLGQKQQLLNQQVEIMYSQLEVKYTRLELHGQKNEMIQQNNTLRIQKFENTFFQMLNLFNSIVNSMDLRNKRVTSEVISTGRDCFEIFYKRLRSCLAQLGDDTQDSASIEITLRAFDDFYNDNRADVSHYFRTLYHIVKFIDRSEIENKKQYISIVRAQLSSYEQMLLFYNCLHSNGKEKFKPLIEKYRLFKNIDDSLIINENHFSEYQESAYGQ